MIDALVLWCLMHLYWFLEAYSYFGYISSIPQIDDHNRSLYKTNLSLSNLNNAEDMVRRKYYSISQIGPHSRVADP
jgi:hypothetical protein